MRLRFSPAQQAWMFLFGDRPVRLHGQALFFGARVEALDAARSVGLRVAPDGLVTLAEPPRTADPGDDARMERTRARREAQDDARYGER